MSHSGRTSQLFINPSVEMKEVPCRREHLHSIISKISGSVEASPSEEECTADNKYITQNDKANSELSIADDQHKPTKNMFTEENVSRTNCTKDGVSRQESPMVERPSAPYNCKPCNVGFLTQRELQLHAMCHGICISGDVKELGLKNTTIDAPDKSKASDGQGEDNESHNDKEIDSRKSPMIPKQTLLTNREARSDHNDHERLSPTYELTGATTDNPAASSVPGEPNASQDSTVNNELGYGKIVDVLSLATATRGFKEPGSIWCSLCKCTVDKGHVCKINQPSYHAEKKEEGFTCELCGRYYNQKRKLRTHLRNRHKGFRLQEDEGYMCWQCWQAFPEIKILEQHIVTVHGHESRRQNSTWRPFLGPNTLPSPGETIDNQPTEDTTQNIAASFGENQNMTSLKRPGDDITNEYPAKRTPEGIVCNKVLNVGEVNGKVVVNDSFLLTTEGPACPKPTMELPPDRAVQMSLSIPCGADKNCGATHNENTSKSPPFDQPNFPTNQTANPSLNITTNNPTTNHLVNPSAIYSSNGNKRKTVAAQKTQSCPHCPEVFSKKYILQLHIQQNHSENMHCFFCSTCCNTKEVLSVHIKDVHTEEVKNGKCPICQCKCLGELHQHIVQYHYKDLLTRKDKDRVLSTCPICHQTTTDAYHLRWHVQNEHGGMVLPGEQQEGSLEETSSESGSSVSSEGRLGNVLPERTTEVTKGTMVTSDGTVVTSDGTVVTSDGTVAEVVKEKARCEETDTDEIEIVFVSDKKPDSDWSKQGIMSNQPRSDSPIKVSKELSNVSGSLVQTIKKPADSSGSVGDGPKLNEKSATADNVDSTTGQEEPKSEEVSLQHQAGRVEQTPCDYKQVSEQACIFCFNNFTDEKTLVTHLKTAHGWLDTFTCPICYYEGQHYLSVVEHFCKSHFHPIDDTLAQSEVKCLKCDIIFQDIAHLKKHSTALHSFQIPCVPRYNTFKCRHCNIVFDKKIDAQKHFDAYHLFRIRYKCESCRMGFTAKYDFQEHVTCNHPELVNSFCPVCGLGFEVNADLEEHVFEMHRRKAQFFCAKCRNEFEDRFHVHMHIRSNCCVQWADSNFECLDCLTAFSSISELRIHCNQKNCKQSGK